LKISKDDFSSVFAQVITSKRPLILSPRGKSVSFLCTPVAMTDEAIIFRNSIPVDILPEIVNSTEFSLVCENYQLVSAALFAHGTDIRFPTHHISVLPQSRSDERHVFSTEEHAEIVIHHPFDAGTQLRRRLYDLSKGGLSFRARGQTRLMQPGRILSQMQLIQAGRESELKSGRVIYIKQIFEESGRHFHQVGVQFISTP